MKFYENLTSKDVFQYFEKISEIPHCSFDEKRISDYLVSFAKERNLEVYQDEELNVIIKKEATSGYEDAPIIMLQGHIDMVCEKNSDVIHDFKTEGIKHVVKGNMLYADGTTLGADNGIAVAIALAILDSKDIPHPKLECIFTVQEEVGLLGANFIDRKNLDGKYLINIDSEEEGIFLVSCAGGCRTDIKTPIEWTVLEGNFQFIKLSISGLRGGHSGMSIHEERGNAIKILGKILYNLNKNFNIEIQELNGGAQDNAIPRESSAIIAINPNQFEKIANHLNLLKKQLDTELNGKDNPININFEKITNEKITVFNQKTKLNVISLILLSQNGVYSMSNGVKGLVESSKNLGILKTDYNCVTASYCVRSSVESLLYSQLDELQILANQINGETKTWGIYPGWEYNPNSKLRDLFLKTYKNIYNTDAKIDAIHAGLECGILKKNLGDVDIISLGPDIFDPHSPDEHLCISSTTRVYEFILEVLKNSNDLK